MKTHVKKKRYQAHCREQIKQGFINTEAGEWRKPRNDGDRKALADATAGYKLSR
jgi:hypothetical protein